MKRKINKKIIVAIFLLALALGFLFVLKIKSSGLSVGKMVQLESGASSDIVYFYGKECFRCDNVDKFINDNLIENKIVFSKKEIWHDTNNKSELEQKVMECGWPEEKVGVPFVAAHGKCYLGETDVENFLKTEANIK